jgi:hypothetical protein
MQTLSKPDFFRILRQEALADALFKEYAAKHEPELLRMYFYQNDDQIASAFLSLEQALLSGGIFYS